MNTTEPDPRALSRASRLARRHARPPALPDQGLVGGSWVLRDVHALLAQIRDYAVITLDVDGTVLSWNAGAEQVKRFGARDIVGTSFARFYTETDQRAGLPGRLLEQASSDGVAHAVGWRVRRDGTLFWADVTISSVREPDGELAGFVKVTRDITAQRLLELDKEQQYAAFTHDLRAPLTAALGYVDLALEHLGEAEGGDPASMHDPSAVGTEGASRQMADRDRLSDTPLETSPEAPTGAAVDAPADTYLKGLLENASRVIMRLELMMERHLDAARAAGTADAGRSDRPERLRLAQVVASTVRTTLESNAADRVHLQMAPETDVVYADRDAVERCLSNVIGNAVKYSEGDVTIATSVADPGDLLLDARQSSGPWVRIAVVDQGRGIHPDDLDTIFEPGERGRLARVDGGHGIGLNSVRQLMERQHGRVSITSEVGVGTTVYLDLPTVALRES